MIALPQKRLKEIHSLALDKKALSSVVGSAIDLSKAHGKQVRRLPILSYTASAHSPQLNGLAIGLLAVGTN
jgi:hypothetical protein